MTIREAICDRLTRLGVSEITQNALMLTLDTRDVPKEAKDQAALGRTIFWIAITPNQARRHDAKLDAFGQISHSAPHVRFASPLEVASDLGKGFFGIALNVADTITQEESGA